MATGIIYVKDRAWKPLKKIYLRDTTWKQVKTAWIKNNGVWQKIFPTPVAIAGTDLQDGSLSFEVYSELQSSSKTITITNTGDTPLRLGKIAGTTDGQFSYQFVYQWLSIGYTVISPNQSATFSLNVIGGTVIGTSSGTIKIPTNIGALGNDELLINVNVTTLPRFAELNSSAKTTPLSLRFDESYVKGKTIDDITYSFTLKNVGNGPVSITEISSDAYVFLPYQTTMAKFSEQVISFKIGAGFAFSNGVLNSGTYNPTINITAKDLTRNETRNLDLDTTLKLVPHGTLTFKSDGSWTVPNNIETVTISVVSAPGGAGASSGIYPYTETTTAAGIGTTVTNTVTISELGGAGGPGTFYSAQVKLQPQQLVKVYLGSAGSPGRQEAFISSQLSAKGGTNALGRAQGGFGGPILSFNQNTVVARTGTGGGGAAATIVQIRNFANTATLGELIVGGGGGGGGGGYKLNGAAGNPIQDLSLFGGVQPTISSSQKDGESGGTAFAEMNNKTYPSGGGGGGGSLSSSAGGGGKGGTRSYTDTNYFSRVVTFPAQGGSRGATEFVTSSSVALVTVLANKEATVDQPPGVTISW